MNIYSVILTMLPEITAQVHAFNTHNEIDYMYYTNNLTGVAKEQYETHPLNFTSKIYEEYSFIPDDKVEWKKNRWNSDEAEPYDSEEDEYKISLKDMPKTVKHLITYWGVKGEDIPDHVEKITFNRQDEDDETVKHGPFIVPPNVKEIKFNHGCVSEENIDSIILKADHDIIVKAYIHSGDNWDSFKYVRGPSLKTGIVLRICVANDDDLRCDYSEYTQLEVFEDVREEVPYNRTYVFSPTIKKLIMSVDSCYNKIDIRKYPALRKIMGDTGTFMLDNEGVGQLEELEFTEYNIGDEVRFDLMTNIKSLSIYITKTGVSIPYIPSTDCEIEIGECVVHALPENLRSLKTRGATVASMVLPNLIKLESQDDTILNNITAPNLEEVDIRIYHEINSITLPLLPKLSKFTLKSRSLKSFSSPIQPNLMGCRISRGCPKGAAKKMFGKKKYKTFTSDRYDIHVRTD
jgi:hypothetical protein